LDELTDRRADQIIEAMVGIVTALSSAITAASTSGAAAVEAYKVSPAHE
jgi:hypothetical protein